MIIKATLSALRRIGFFPDGEKPKQAPRDWVISQESISFILVTKESDYPLRLIDMELVEDRFHGRILTAQAHCNGGVFVFEVVIRRGAEDLERQYAQGRLITGYSNSLREEINKAGGK